MDELLAELLDAYRHLPLHKLADLIHVYYLTCYHKAGSPFGDTEQGLMLWLEYRQHTTVN